MIFQNEFFVEIMLLIPLIFLTVTIVFLILFIQEYLKTKHKMIGYLIIFFLNSLFLNVFQVFEIITSGEVRVYSYMIVEVFTMLSFYIMVVILEVFERDVSFSRRQSILSILIFTSIGGMISTPTFKSIPGQIFEITWADEENLVYIQIIFFIVAAISLISMLYRNYKTAWSIKQKKIIRWLFIGVFFSIFFPIIAYLIIIFLTEISELILAIFLLLSLFIMNSGSIIIGVAFLRVKKEPWLLQRQKVHLIIVYSRDGIQIYSKIFNKSLSESKTVLLTGSFSAITSLFQETTETAGAVKSVLLEDKELRIINKDHFVCAILEDYSTQASESAHENFTKDFEKAFKEELEGFDGEVSVFQSADQIASKYFS